MELEVVFSDDRNDIDPRSFYGAHFQAGGEAGAPPQERWGAVSVF